METTQEYVDAAVRPSPSPRHRAYAKRRTEAPHQLPVLHHSYGGEIIRQRSSDGYIDATALCKAASREWADYARLDGTQAFLAALSSDTGFPLPALVQSGPGETATGQVTWVHPRVAVHVAQWLSPQIAVPASRWVFDWMSGMGSPLSTRRNYSPALADRYHIHQPEMPAGYFSCVSELYAVAYDLLEREGYAPPDKGVPTYDVRLELCIHRMFRMWLRERKIEYSDIFYTHHCPDGRKIKDCRAFPNSMLGLFQDFVINAWMRRRGIFIWDRFDPEAIPFIEKVLAVLPRVEPYQVPEDYFRRPRPRDGEMHRDSPDRE